jgi:phosphoribosylformimino-5-aminoimidazole carboxamide ribotide isomerase
MKWNVTPSSAAKRWQDEGATGIHVVDLDGALQTGSNRDAVESILRAASVPVEVGGGIRTVADAERWLGLGVHRVILGTLAYNSPSETVSLFDEYGSDRFVVALDYRKGRVVTQGWTRTEDVVITEAITRFQAAHVKTLLITAVELDGTGAGPDWVTLQALRKLTNMTLLASGGVRTVEDVVGLRSIGMDGVVIGRALYDGTICLNELKLKE